MEESVQTLRMLYHRGTVYGLPRASATRGHKADNSSTNSGLGLISHLAVGQGAPLSPAVTRLMLWLRLSGMKHGYSAVPVEVWLRLASLWNRGFTPVVPCEGSVSASGDLVPLAHAAFAFAGIGEAWDGSAAAGWTRISAQRALAAIGAEGCSWRHAGHCSQRDKRQLGACMPQSSGNRASSCIGSSHAVACLLLVDPAFPRCWRRGDEGHIDAAKWIRSLMPGGPGALRACIVAIAPRRLVRC
jgi:histidine ammonia-lyase